MAVVANPNLLTLTEISLPFRHRLPLPIEENTLLTINGKIFPTTERFQVDFLNAKGDVYIHINPRFNENVIIRNSRLNGKWGEEERTKSLGPLCSSSGFQMMILFKKESCSVSTNGVHLFKYFYRMPLDEIKEIGILGDIDVSSIYFSRNVMTFDSGYKAPIEIRNPKIPYITPLRTFESGLTITISGKPKQRGDFFTINFENEDLIFLHMSVRLHEQAIVRNSKKKLIWDTEERSLVYFPFKQGLSFDMYITVTDKEYFVAINGQFFFKFLHRYFDNVTQFSIKGDIEVHSVKFEVN